jgi:hypothetical protein
VQTGVCVVTRSFRKEGLSAVTRSFQEAWNLVRPVITEDQPADCLTLSGGTQSEVAGLPGNKERCSPPGVVQNHPFRNRLTL